MKLDHKREKAAVVVRPRERAINAAVVLDFKNQMIKLVEEGNADFVINLTDVEVIDSSGLGALVSVMKRVGKNGEIKLSNARENIRSLFELTRLDKVFHFYHSEEDAVASFRKKS